MSVADKCINQKSLTFIASTFATLEDLAKSPYIGARHAHCQFPYKQYERCKYPLERQLIQVGFETLFFKDHGLINLTDN